MSYTCLLTHIVFSTKERNPFLADKEARDATHAYIGGIVRNLKGRAYTIGGVADHVHMLISTPPALAIADAVRTLKTNSSKWLHEEMRGFAWQEKYSAFSVSQSDIDAVVKYIEGQEEHHRRKTFQEELLELLKEHGVEYDPRYIWV
jgi:putative transposase